MKRRTTQAKKLRDRRTGKSPYQRYGKIRHAYSWEKPVKRKGE